MDQKSWLEWRRGGIGSSDAAVIMGVSPWSTRYLLWKDKVHGVKDNKKNSSMQRGNDLEPVVREMLENEFHILLESKNVVHPLHDWMRASLDAISLDKKQLFEIKCPNAIDHAEAKSGKVPAKYWPQVQHQLAVTGLVYMNYVSYYQDRLALVKVQRDESYIEKLLEEENKFWECVLQKVAPEKTSQDAEEMDENEEWRALCEQWQESQQNLKKYQEEEQALRHRIISLSDGRNAVGAGVKLLKIEEQGRVDYEGLLNSHMEILQRMFPNQILPGYNLDAHRKAPIVKYRLSVY